MLLKETIRHVARSQYDALFLQDYGIEREKLGEIELGTPFATVISGVRRCGKSTLMRQMMKKSRAFYYFNFDDPRIFGFEAGDFQRLDEVFLEEFGKRGRYFFDEIQNAGRWELFVRALLERKGQVVLTGSNASLLSRELGTRLTGRHLNYELFPFSYKEFLKIRRKEKGEESFLEYMKCGGFPEYLKNEKAEILQQLLNDIIARDISVRHRIRSLKVVKELGLYLLSNIGKEFTYNSLKKTFGLGSANSAISFVSFFEDSYLLFTVPRFDYSMKKQLVSPKKAYAIDNGLVRANSVSFSDDLGRLLENSVYLHLRRKYGDIYYFREKGECDFLIKEGTRITSAVQVCFKLTEENRGREIGGLLEAMERLGLKEGVMLTCNQEDEIDEGKKRVILKPAWKWMAE